MNYTNEQIKQAAERCSNEHDPCAGCPLDDENMSECRVIISRRLFALESENTGLKDIAGRYEQLQDKHKKLMAEADTLESENADLRNELCQRCGRYKQAHEGACNGCRWKK